jgi:type 1 fimbriae regulatory protein FimB/type 1 fimbriae regulatory protein FimE
MVTRLKNADYRSREHLTPDEVKRLLDAASLRGRHPVRDRAIVLLSFRHGLRAGEAARLKWDGVMLDSRAISINRLKGSISGTHPLQEDELELLSDLKVAYPDRFYLFMNERGQHISPAAIAKMIARAGALAELPVKVHPHMLRHSCGYWLAEQGVPTRDIQEYLGHRNIQNTVRYTAGNPARFNAFRWNT